MHLEKGFKEEELSAEAVRHMKGLSRMVRSDILKMTQLAGSGRPGACMSSVEILVTLLAAADMNPLEPQSPKRDRVLVREGGVVSTSLPKVGWHNG